MTMLQANKTLQSLNLSDIKSIDDDGFSRIVKLLMRMDPNPGNVTLQELSVVSCKLSACSYELMLEYLRWKHTIGIEMRKISREQPNKDFGLRKINFRCNEHPSDSIQVELDDMVDRLKEESGLIVHLDHKSKINLIRMDKEMKELERRRQKLAIRSDRVDHDSVA